MNDINYYLNYTRTNLNHDNIILPELVESYNNTYNDAISTFSILINTDRAEEGYLNNNINNKIKLLLDMKDSPTKASFKPTLWRSIWIESNKIKTGDYITIKNKIRNNEETYVILHSYETKDGYDICYIQYCNNTLTFETPLNKTISIPAIISNLTLYSDGLEVKTITSLDGKRNVIVPLNNETKDLFVQQRFIFNHNSIFSISLIDDFSVNGLLQLTMIQDTFKDTDDKLNNLADNGELPITITFPQTSYTINQNNTLQLQPVIKQGDKILNLSVNYTSETLDNEGVVNVDNLGNVTGISIGTSKVICRLVDNSDIVGEVEVRVLYANPVPAISYLVSGNSEIRKTSTSTYTSSRLSNNVEDTSATFQFFLDYNGLPTSAVNMTQIDSKTIKIKNNNVENGSIILRAMDLASGINTYKTIQLRGLYG